MAYEIVQQIGLTNFCLTFDTGMRKLAIKFYSGDDAGATFIEKPIPKTKNFEVLTGRAPEFQYIKKKCLSINVEKLSHEAKHPDFALNLESALEDLKEKYMEWLDGAEERAEKERKEREEEEQEALEELISEGAMALEETDYPLLWIGSTIDWLTAGERMNIMYAWIAYCSQIILENPISVVGIGEANSGKSHILELALDLLPQEYIMVMKSATMAATYALAETDPRYFDKKIVFIGDMGGGKDHEESQLFKDLMKELQTDGIAKRVKMVDGPEGPEPKWYILEGYPCLSYTTVPGYEFEDQEMSRSVMLSPRQDNDKAVGLFKHLNQVKSGRTRDNIERYRERIPIVRNMVLALKHRMEFVEIINPYRQFIEDYLSKTKYFKRDFDKYNGILKVITAINGYKRELIDDVLFTTRDDICIFIELLSRYHESITSNLSPNASDILKELRDKADTWDLYDTGITIVDYQVKSPHGDRYARKSLQRYFSEMNNAGILKVVDKDGQKNVYALVDTGFKLNPSDICLNEWDKEFLEYNYGIDENKLEYIGGVPLPGQLSKQVDKPFWNKALPENRRIE